MSKTIKTASGLAIRVKEKFEQVFGDSDTLTVRSPGRVNLIGEHTDYNHGFVLPAAVDKAIYMVVSRRQDDEGHLFSFDLDKGCAGSLSEIVPSGLHWPDYLLGVVQQLQLLGLSVGGF